MKITQLKKVHFIKENELKLTQVELFLFFHFKYVGANVYDSFRLAYLAIDEHFLYHSIQFLRFYTFLESAFDFFSTLCSWSKYLLLYLLPNFFNFHILLESSNIHLLLTNKWFILYPTWTSGNKQWEMKLVFTLKMCLLLKIENK